MDQFWGMILTLLIVNGDMVLKSKAVFGANGSGKSNLVRAIGSMQLIISRILPRKNYWMNIESCFLKKCKTGMKTN